MSSTLRAESSRANGAKSRGPVTPEGKRATAEAATGPVTPEGKAIVSRNAVRHGLLSQSVVLPSESILAFEEIIEGLRAELRPVTSIEHTQVEVMANAAWRRNRLWCFEMAILSHALYAQERQGDAIADRENTIIPAMHTALAFAALNNQSTILQNLNRYEVRYSREYQRALRIFKEQRAERLQNDALCDPPENLLTEPRRPRSGCPPMPEMADAAAGSPENNDFSKQTDLTSEKPGRTNGDSADTEPCTAPPDAPSDTIASSYLPPGPSPASVEQVEEPVEELYDA